MNWQRIHSTLRRFAGDQADDLMQHTYLITADAHPEYPETYFITVAKYQFFNKKSEFNKLHNSQIFNGILDTDTPDHISDILYTPEKNPDIDVARQIYVIYLHHGENLSKLSKVLGVHRHTLKTHIDRYIQHIKDNYSKHLADGNSMVHTGMGYDCEGLAED
jgi:hypothetical protein